MFWLPWGQRGQAGCATPSIPCHHEVPTALGIPSPAEMLPQGRGGPRARRTLPGAHGRRREAVGVQKWGLFDSALHFMWITVSPDTAHNEAAWDIKAN